MFKQVNWGELLFILVLGSLAAIVFLVPEFAGAELARFNAGMSLVLSTALVWVTARYTGETTRIAEASKQQIEAMQQQLALETEPNLLAVLGEPQPSSASIVLNLVNLSRRQVWVTKVTSEIAPYSGPDQKLSLHGGRALTPEKPATIGMYIRGNDAEKIDGKVEVEFYYGPTGSKLHSKAWLLTIDGEDARITEL